MKASATYREMLERLDTLIAWFQDENNDVQAAVEKYKEGLALAASIENELLQAENKISILRQQFEER